MITGHDFQSIIISNKTLSLFSWRTGRHFGTTSHRENNAIKQTSSTPLLLLLLLLLLFRISFTVATERRSIDSMKYAIIIRETLVCFSVVELFFFRRGVAMAALHLTRLGLWYWEFFFLKIYVWQGEWVNVRQWESVGGWLVGRVFVRSIRWTGVSWWTTQKSDKSLEKCFIGKSKMLDVHCLGNCAWWMHV